MGIGKFVYRKDESMRKLNPLKSALALLVALMMCLSFLPGTALAEGEENPPGESAAKQMTGEEFLNTADSTGKITLTENVHLTSTAKVESNQTIVLDLNSYQITVPQENGRSLYAVDNFGTMTVTDSGNNGKIVARGIENYGTMYMQGGTIASCDSNGGGAAVWNEGSFEMTGGTLEFTGIKSGNNAGCPFSNSKETATATITGGELVSPYTCMFVNSGTVAVENISVGNSTSYFMAFKVSGGSLTMRNVTINSKEGGSLEAAGGTVDLYDCNFTQGPMTTVPGQAHTSACIAASYGGTVRVHGGNYSSAGFGAYVYNSGGTISVESGTIHGDNAAIIADTSADGKPASITIETANVTGAIKVNEASGVPVTIQIEGGRFDTDVSQYLTGDLVQNADGEIVKPAPAATANGVEYPTLQAAVNAGGNVVLCNDVTENIKVTQEHVSIDLNGHKLVDSAAAQNGDIPANKRQHTITVEATGSLTITGAGTVDNVSHGRCAIWNEGTVILEGGDFTRSAENGKSTENSGGNSYYNIVNRGTMEIYDGVSVLQEGLFSSLIDNGWNEKNVQSVNTSGKNASLTIYGGLFDHGKYPLKNDAYGILDIQGGTFQNGLYAVLNYSDATINGGTFYAQKDIVYNWSATSEVQPAYSYPKAGTITISDGRFIYAADRSAINAPEGAGPVAITGGTFSGNVQEFCAEKYDCIQQANGLYIVCGHPEEAAETTGASEPTCTTPGSTGTTTCTVCGKVTAEATERPIIAHTAVTDPAVPATCTSTGLTEGSHCSVCNTVLVAQTETEMTAHTPVEAPALAATCTTAGHAAGTVCSVCGAVLGGQEVIAALGHDFGGWTVSTAATCGANGVETRVCSRDGAHIETRTIAATGNHTWNGGVVTTPATAATDGVRTYTCTVCNAARTETIPAYGYYYPTYPSTPSTSTTTPSNNNNSSSSNNANNEVSINDSDVPLAQLPNNTLAMDVDTTLLDGAASAVLDAASLSALTSKAQETNSANVTLRLSGTANAETSAVSLTPEAVAALASQTKADLTLEMGGTSVTLSNDALASLGGGTGNIIVTVSSVDAETVDVLVSQDGKKLETISGGLTAEIPAAHAGPGTVAILVAADGSETLLKKAVAVDGLFHLELDGSATLKVVDNAKSFTDTQNHWAGDAIAFVTSRELFQGVSGDAFAADTPMNRAMLVTVLHRLEDAPAAGEVSFPDVPADQWFTQAVAWAAESGIVKGKESGFDPYGQVSRQELAAFLYRYAGYIGADVSASGDLSKFEDASGVSDWAEEAMRWAVGSGIITGRNGDFLAAGENATRAEVATILMRFCQNLAK